MRMKRNHMYTEYRGTDHQKKRALVSYSTAYSNNSSRGPYGASLESRTGEREENQHIHKESHINSRVHIYAGEAGDKDGGRT